MNHQILISSDLEGEFPCAALLERTVAAALEAEGVATPLRGGRAHHRR